MRRLLRVYSQPSFYPSWETTLHILGFTALHMLMTPAQISLLSWRHVYSSKLLNDYPNLDTTNLACLHNLAPTPILLCFSLDGLHSRQFCLSSHDFGSQSTPLSHFHSNVLNAIHSTPFVVTLSGSLLSVSTAVHACSAPYHFSSGLLIHLSALQPLPSNLSLAQLSKWFS